ncbi:MAG: ROK family glucokinase [Mycobacterium leprae]
MGLTIGIDVGGTKVAAGVVDERGHIVAEVRRETPARDPKAVEDTIAAAVEDLAPGATVVAVGVGAAGFIDASGDNVLFAPNLAWRNERLREAIERRLGMPVTVENDANAATWAEARFGAGRGFSHLVCVTVGTGIGGGIVLGGELYRGRWGLAGEFGHMRVVPDGIRCGCGNKGCWEMYASGSALVRAARELLAADSPIGERLRELCGGDPATVTGPIVTTAAMEGDPAAGELFDELAQWLGQGIATLTALLDPECVVVGGGVSEAGAVLLAPAREAFRRSLTGRGFRPELTIRLAELGNAAGLIGAADLARRRSSPVGVPRRA